ncbi:MAG: flavodoxin-dependent (E)-4-hydroxy-3-methylbut-2-enyl-diphosphate synthase, partial [Bacteroidales bacterium]
YFKKIKEVMIENPNFSMKENEELALSIMQACRLKMSKTEFISCPSCGRTQYDIEKVLAMTKERFSHYPGLKLGIMGCVVNGPGEMADADYGIVGACNGMVIVYKGKEKASEIVSVEQAFVILENLINKHG